MYHMKGMHENNLPKRLMLSVVV